MDEGHQGLIFVLFGMQIRAATESDIPAIVELLKISLGESLMPKSERYWRWKHLGNPFGNSPVLLCWEGDTLIGVRAFMRWEWIYEGKIYSSLRAVDTATHPDHQGKGIFKKLTLALVDQCKAHGDQFIFNTPNKQSKPGYLKMGWQEAGNLPLVMGVQRPLKILSTLLSKGDGRISSDNSELAYFLNHPQLPELIKRNHRNEKVSTNISVQYLKWRYLVVPVAKYVALGEEEAGELKTLIIARVKHARLGTEFRITDCLTKSISGSRVVRLLDTLKKTNGIDYTTISGLGSGDEKRLVGKLRLTAALGPIVTIRALRLTDLGILQNFNQWSPTLGDLELF